MPYIGWVRIIYMVYILLVSLEKIRSKMGFWVLASFLVHSCAWAWIVLGHFWGSHPHWIPHMMLIILVVIVYLVIRTRGFGYRSK